MMSQSHHRHHHSVHGGVEHETHAAVEASEVSILETKLTEPTADVAKTSTSLHIPKLVACMSLVTSDLEWEPKSIQQAASGNFKYRVMWNVTICQYALFISRLEQNAK